MKTKTSPTIEPGELAVFSEKVWLAEAYDGSLPCIARCGMYDAEAGRCPGHCYRWDNGEEVVFRFILPVGLVKDDTVVVETPDPILRRFEGCEGIRRSQVKYYDTLRSMRQGSAARGYGNGTLYKRQTVWCGDIMVDGVSLHYSRPDKAEVEKWLDGMVSKKKALKELAKLKKNNKKSR